MKLKKNINSNNIKNKYSILLFFYTNRLEFLLFIENFYFQIDNFYIDFILS
jgi:hypothetical protein